MFFFLSKTLGWLATPSNLVVALVVAGLLLRGTRLTVAGRRILLLAAAMFLLFAFTPLGNCLLVPLEQRFPIWDATQGAPTGIIVLGGSISPELSKVYRQPVISSDADRLIAAADLARRFPDTPIFFTGPRTNTIRWN
jgi:uncharacterized SAM-binding protein YcdF (DUF218 family)